MLSFFCLTSVSKWFIYITMKLNTPKIKKEMLRNNWNITVLAKRIGISRQQLSYVISDRYKSKSLLIIERIAKALKINQRDLIK